MISKLTFDTHQDELRMPLWYRTERYDFCEHLLDNQDALGFKEFFSNLYHRFF